MEIKETKNDAFLLLEIGGRLDTSNYSQLESRLMGLIDEGHLNILVDCSGLDYVSSSGLRILLMALKKLSAAKGKFVLCSLQDNIKEIFDISGFSSIFPIYEKREEAEASF